jgi:hypothetical protein
MKKTIKTLALLAMVFLAQYPFESTAQTCIEYKNTGITIRCNSINENSNTLNYDVKCPIEWLDITQDILSITMTCKDGVCVYSSVASVPNLPSIYDAYTIESIDVGKSLKQARETFGVNLILGYGLLKLDYNWTIKNK